MITPERKAQVTAFLNRLGQKAIVQRRPELADVFLDAATLLGYDPDDHRPRCRKCGRAFDANRMGRPRLDCQECSPSKVVAEKSGKVRG